MIRLCKICGEEFWNLGQQKRHVCEPTTNIKICPTGAFGWGNGQHNYCAYDDNTYDGLGSLMGYGRTPEAAEYDLLCQIADSKLD